MEIQLETLESSRAQFWTEAASLREFLPATGIPASDGYLDPQIHREIQRETFFFPAESTHLNNRQVTTISYLYIIVHTHICIYI